MTMLIEAGSWKAICREGTLAFTNKERKPQVALGFELLEGPNVGAFITWYGYFTDETWERTLESLRMCGWGGSDLSDLSGIDTQEVRLVIVHEPDLNGEIRARVNWVNSLGGIAVKQRMDVGEAKAFAAQMRGRIIAHGAASGRSTQRPTGAAPQPPHEPSVGPGASGDDIPF